jgi:hypothetical protein
MKLEFTAFVWPSEKSKRRALVEAIELALSTNGVRIHSGYYAVTIERTTEPPPDPNNEERIP